MAVVKLGGGKRTDEAGGMTERRPHWALGRCRNTVDSVEHKKSRT